MWCLLFALSCFAAEDPYVLFLTNNQRVEVQAPPECEGQRCVLVLTDGSRISLPANLIDQERTRRYNEEMARRKQEQEEAAAAAAEEAGDSQEEREPVTLTSVAQMPVYDRSRNTVSGTAGPVAPEPLGPPQVRNFSSEDPVYVSKETITRFADGYRIEYEVKINNSAGARNVALSIKVNYANEAAQELTQDLGDMSFGDVKTAAFALEMSDEILFTSYQITGDLPTLR